MDLKDLIPDTETLTIEIEYKDKVFTNEDGSPMTIEVYLPHSKVGKQAEYKKSDSILRKGGEFISTEEWVDIGNTYFADITKGWDLTLKGEKPAFSNKKAKKIYEELAFIPKLIEEKVSAQVDFT